jgi:hypothetical protein
MCKPALLDRSCIQRLRRVELHLALAFLPDAVCQKQMVAPQVRQPALCRLSLRSEEKRCATLMAARPSTLRAFWCRDQVCDTQ